jgi:hypothetical protein
MMRSVADSCAIYSVLVELEVEFDKIPHLSSTAPPKDFVLPWPY